MKKIVIALTHSTHSYEKPHKLEVELQGGSPWFAYIWIDDVCYTIYKTNRGVTIKKTKI